MAHGEGLGERIGDAGGEGWGANVCVKLSAWWAYEMIVVGSFPFVLDFVFLIGFLRPAEDC